MTRKATNAVLGAVEEGRLDRDTLIMACLKYMSEDEVEDMARINELLPADACEDCGSEVCPGADGDVCEQDEDEDEDEAEA